MPRVVGATLLWRTILALLCGVGAALAFPPYDVVVCLPLAIAGLVAVTPHQRGGAGFLVGFLFGMGLMLPLLRWLTVIGSDAWVAVAALEALAYGLMGTAWSWLRGTRWWPVGFAACWVGAEELRSIVPFGGLPWGRLAFGLVDTPLVGYGRLGGTALVSFVTVLAIALVAGVLLRHRLDGGAVGALVLAIGMGAGSLLVPLGLAGDGRQVTVAAVQGNVPGSGMNPFAERRAVLDNHVAATRELAGQVAAGSSRPPDLVVWPENASDIDPFRDASAYSDIDAAVRAVGVPTLVGAVIAGPGGRELDNVGIVWDPQTGPGSRYVKRHVVPFGEYIPFRGFLTNYVDRLDQIPLDFARGTSAGVLDVGPARVGDVICFEVAYDGLLRDVVDGGAQLVVVQTNNATYTGTGQLEQQFAISRYRAIETGRFVVVAATSGISGILAPDGSTVAVSTVGTRAVLDAQVTLATRSTPGLRYGLAVAVLLSLLGVAMAGAARLAIFRRIGTMAT